MVENPYWIYENEKMTKKASVHGAATFQKYETEFWSAPKSSKFWGVSSVFLFGFADYEGWTCHSKVRRLVVLAYTSWSP
jgi:hypothetical protein